MKSMINKMKLHLTFMGIHANAMLLYLLSLNLFIENVVGQLSDNNGNRNREYDDNRYDGGTSIGSSQTLLEVVKSINYLSEVSLF